MFYLVYLVKLVLEPVWSFNSIFGLVLRQFLKPIQTSCITESASLKIFQKKAPKGFNGVRLATSDTAYSSPLGGHSYAKIDKVLEQDIQYFS